MRLFAWALAGDPAYRHDGRRIVRSGKKDPDLPVLRGLSVLQPKASPSINFHSPCKVTRRNVMFHVQGRAFRDLCENCQLISAMA